MSMESTNKLIEAIITDSEFLGKLFKKAITEHVSGHLEAARSEIGASMFEDIQRTVCENKHSELVYYIGEDIKRFQAVDKDLNPIHHEMYSEEYAESSMYARVDHSQKIVGILPSKELGDNYSTIFESFLSTLKESFSDYTFYGRTESTGDFDILSESWILNAQII